MFNTPRGDMTQHESEVKRRLHLTPAQRLESDVRGSIEVAQRSDAIRARLARAILAAGITVGGFVGLDQLIQKVGPEKYPTIQDVEKWADANLHGARKKL